MLVGKDPIHKQVGRLAEPGSARLARLARWLLWLAGWLVAYLEYFEQNEIRRDDGDD